MNDDIITIEPEDMEIEGADEQDPNIVIISEEDLQQAATTFAEQWDKNFVVIEDVDLQNADKNQRFYDKLRGDIRAWAKGKGVHNKYLEYILLAPDFFFLLVRLTADNRVPTKLRTMLVVAAAYFISPIDAMPEAILGPIGYLDDIVFTALGIFTTLKHVDAAIIREHWSGEDDIIALTQKIVNVGETLVGPKLWNSLKKKVGYDDQRLLDRGQ